MSFYNLSEKTKRHSDVSGYDYITIQDTGKSSNLQNQFGRVERDFTFTLLDQSSHIIPSEGFLEMSFKMVKVNAGGNGYEDLAAHKTLDATEAWTFADNDDNKAAFASNVLNFFRRKSLKIGGVNIEDTPNFAGQQMNAESLIHFTNQYDDTVGSNLLSHYITWKDAVNDDFVDGFNDTANRDSSTSHRARRTTGNREIHCMVPLSLIFNIFQHHKKMFTNIPMEFNFEVNDDSALVLRSSGVSDRALNWVGYGMRIWMPRVTLAPSPLAGVLSYINKSGMVQAVFESSQIQRKEFAAGDTYISWPVPIKSHTRIKRAIIFCQTKNRETSQEHDMSRFDSGMVRKISVDLNGIKVPSKDLEIEVGKNKWESAYKEYMKMHSAYKDPEGMGFTTQGLLSYNDWKYYPMYCFDLQNTLNQDSVSSTQANTLTVNIEREVSYDMYLYCLVYYDKVVDFNLKTGIVQEVSAVL